MILLFRMFVPSLYSLNQSFSRYGRIAASANIYFCHAMLFDSLPEFSVCVGQFHGNSTIRAFTNLLMSFLEFSSHLTNTVDSFTRR